MRADTGFHADEAGGHVGEAALDLSARPLLTQHDGAGLVVANDMEGVLADIDAGDGDTGMSCASGHWAGAPIAAAPLSSVIRWRGGSTAGPFHKLSSLHGCADRC